MYIILISLGGLGVGILGAFLLSQNIKKTLLGLEPEEIINDSAIKILQLENNLDKNLLIGRNIEEVIPTTHLISVMETGASEYDKEQSINNAIIMSNRVPIKHREKIVGAIATFRDKTEVTRLAEELTGVKHIVKALRANNHEFMNKLHVILGLIHIGELEEATSLENNVADISNNVLVTILGNLIENAMEATSKSIKEDRYVNVKIQESTKEIKIEIQDSGIGIEKEYINTIFERGYTTKPGSSGVGLALVKEAIANLKGEITVVSELNQGTIITVLLPRVRC